MGNFLEGCNLKVNEFYSLIETKGIRSYKGSLRTGVDLGTANIVIAVVDEDNNPVAGAMVDSKVVKDGIVVDYIGAVNNVEKLKRELELRIGTVLDKAATAIPPGIIPGNIKAIANVVEAAGFEVTDIVDEPAAAAEVIGLKDGAVVDVGGGTTGISILSDGKVLYSADEATGGTHMTLVLAGYEKVPVEEAELKKRDPKQEQYVFPIIKPVVEKMATIVKKYLVGYDVSKIYVVGGACSFTQFEKVFENIIGIETKKPDYPLLITPLGIAMSCGLRKGILTDIKSSL